MIKLNVGDKVHWGSHGCGYWKEKSGKVVIVLNEDTDRWTLLDKIRCEYLGKIMFSDIGYDFERGRVVVQVTEDGKHKFYVPDLEKLHETSVEKKELLFKDNELLLENEDLKRILSGLVTCINQIGDYVKDLSKYSEEV